MISMCVSISWKILYLLGILWTLTIVCRGSQAIEQCKEGCNTTWDAVVTILDDPQCNSICRIDQCYGGCVWPESIGGSCDSLCMNKKYCLNRCLGAIQLYAGQLRESLGNLSQPELKSITNSSIQLLWSLDNGTVSDSIQKVHTSLHLENASVPELFIQWKYADLSDGWTSNSTISSLVLHNDNTYEISITMLWSPYTAYKFRIVLFISEDVFLVTPETNTIITEAYRAPTSIVEISTITSSSSDTVTIKWIPVRFPILGYKLELTSLSDTIFPVEEFVKYGRSQYVFHDLQASTSYNITVIPNNRYGDGPASYGIVTTLPRSEVEKDHYLVIGANNMVYAMDSMVFSSRGNVMALDVHHWKKLLFVVNSFSEVFYGNLFNISSMHLVYNQSHKIVDIAVDWLNDKVYLAEPNKVLQCSLQVTNCSIIIDDEAAGIMNIIIDPIRGYLYLTDDILKNLYKVDTYMFHNNTGHSLSSIAIIIYSGLISSIALDVTSDTIYLTKPTATNFFTLDDVGVATKDKVVHSNIATNQIGFVTSLVYFNGLFYWSDGSEIYQEHYSGHMYYHNPIMHFMENITFYGDIKVSHPLIQPYPVPQSSPMHVQAVLSDNSAHISWKAPDISSYYGKGAYNTWQYAVYIKRNETKEQMIKHVTDLQIQVGNLTADTTYQIQVEAYSEGGHGPLSDVFNGTTHIAGDVQPTILVSGGGALFEMSLFRENISTLPKVQESSVIDFNWLDDLWLWLDRNGKLFKYNTTTKTTTNTSLSNCIAFDIDWLGRLVYWSNGREHTIRRTGISSDAAAGEVLYDNTEAIDIAVDSINAYMYWTTSHTVEAIRLNGDEESWFQYLKLDLLSGQHVLGLTLDISASSVYWVVVIEHNAQLFKASMMADTGTVLPPTVTHIGDISSKPSLHFFSRHILWSNRDGNIVISDLSGGNQAFISKYIKVDAFTVKHPSLHPKPKSFTNVIPHSVLPESVIVQGQWDNFNISWPEDNSVTYGQLFYDIHLMYNNRKFHKVLTSSYVNLEDVDPFTSMTLSIRPYTYWATANETSTQLHSPMSVPGKPSNIRVFTTHHRENILSNKTTICVEWRWKAPRQVNGVIDNYTVLIGREGTMNTSVVTNTTYRFKMESSQNDVEYYFQVAACTTGIGCGNNSQVVSVNTSLIFPPPMMLIGNTSNLHLLDIDLKSSSPVVTMPTSQPIKSLGYLANENTYFTLDDTAITMIQGKSIKKLKEVTRCYSLTVDWLGRTIYWLELNTSLNKSSIFKFDLGKGSNALSIVANISTKLHHLEVIPYMRQLVWSAYENGIVKLFTSKIESSRPEYLLSVIENEDSHSRLKRSQGCLCGKNNSSIGLTFTVDNTQPSPVLYWVDVHNNILMELDIMKCVCRIVHILDINDVPTALTVDTRTIYWTSNNSNVLYGLQKDSNSLDTYDVSVSVYTSYGQYLQNIPDANCLLLSGNTTGFSFMSHTNMSITLGINPMQIAQSCSEMSLPTVIYHAYYIESNSTVTCNIRQDTKCSHQETSDNFITLAPLKPYTTYSIGIGVSNYYSPLKQFILLSHVYQTKYGIPGRVDDLRGSVLNPETIALYWSTPNITNGPKLNLTYSVLCKTVNIDGSISQDHTTPGQYVLFEKEHKVILNNLEAGQLYSCQVLTYSPNGQDYNTSNTVEITSHSYPYNITLVDRTSSSITVAWHPPTVDKAQRVLFQYKQKTATTWKFGKFIILKNSTVVTTFSQLYSGTSYTITLKIVHGLEIYIWPKDDRFTFSTIATVPVRLLPPKVIVLSNEEYKVVWSPSHNGGLPITQYKLEYSISDELWDTQVVYNGSETSWKVEGLAFGTEYVFRVAAMNSLGWSPFSPFSATYVLPQGVSAKSVEKVSTLTIVLSVVFTVIVLVVVLLTAVFFLVYRRRNKEKRLEAIVNNINHSRDTELAVIRVMPQGQMEYNTSLYSNGYTPTAEDINCLPHFRSEQISLIKFLGSGAFGEVYEGLARDSRHTNTHFPVAVKTLRKGASTEYKEEFLKEAVLMSNFKHNNILKLLGVCLDSEPQFIILELMEEGDLLSYLRSCRRTPLSPARLNYADLVRICLDVCRGCKYLEDLHFVHRDLAARNCLVTISDTMDRTVKIGDFGLARDIYKNDYYRKEGEGLLPVRWMSPEALVDGIFTTQSDVWAYGVLVWEVMTLGQQPYPARTNIDVLHYVRDGGYLDQPTNCPATMYDLMLKCWHYESGHRPSFFHILTQVDMLADSCEADDSGFVQPVRSPEPGVDNLGFEDNESPSCHPKQKVSSSAQAKAFGSVKLTPTSKHRRLKTLLGQNAQSDNTLLKSNGTIKNTEFSDHNPKFKRSISLDVTNLDKRIDTISYETDGNLYVEGFEKPREKKSDNDGYLNPRTIQNHKYLKMFDDSPIRSLTPVKERPIARDSGKALPAIKNSLVSNGNVQYAHLAMNKQHNHIEKRERYNNEDDSDPPNESSEHVTYASIASTSNHDNGSNDDQAELPTTITYAKLAGTLESNDVNIIQDEHDNSFEESSPQINSDFQEDDHIDDTLECGHRSNNRFGMKWKNVFHRGDSGIVNYVRHNNKNGDYVNVPKN